MNSPLYLIWSEEHGAWWSPDQNGYTRSIREAGRYSLEQAIDIVQRANAYCKPGSFNEIAIPDIAHSFK
jgi:hypothetical protein